MVDRVRAIRAACRSRVRRSISGAFSIQVSSLRVIVSRLASRKPAIPNAASTMASSQPQSRVKSDSAITIRRQQRQGLVQAVELIDDLGTTKIMRTATTPMATTARTADRRAP